MSGLLALLDDVAGIAKIAASSLDDVATQAAKAGAKAAGALIDDAAVTPKYVIGFAADRELPIIWRIAKGSFRNKLLYLLPVGLLLANFAPWMISPLLMLGGAYLCFEGAEKIAHLFLPHAAEKQAELTGNPAQLEEQKAAGAIKTDFILSAEIMTISLAAIPESNIWMEAATLALVGIGITVVVYGSVAVIVKMDDFGLFVARNGHFAVTRSLGRGLVKAMPGFMSVLLVVGTGAMLWVGGSIIIHGLEQMGYGAIGHTIHDWAAAVAHQAPIAWHGAVEWGAKAVLDGVFGVMLGLILVPIAVFGIAPVWARLTKRANG